MSALSASLEDLIEQKKAFKSFLDIKSLRSSGYDSGEIRSSFKGRGLELEEIREYVFGDDVRDIDWRVSARKQEPYTKVYSQERDREVYVLLDLSNSMIFGTKKELKSVSACKIAAKLGWLALENKDKFGLIIYSGRENFVFKAQSGLKQFMAILKKISDISEAVLDIKSDSLEIASSLSLLQHNSKPDGIVFIVSDFDWFDDAAKKELLPIFKKSNTTLIEVKDTLEEKAPRAGLYMAEFEGQKIILDTTSQAYQKKYYQYFKAKQSDLQNFCQSFGARLFRQN